MLNELYDLMKRYERKGSFTYAEVNDDILSEAEKVLKCKLPAEYISFLKTFGQGGIGGLEVLGVGKDGSLVFVNKILMIVCQKKIL